MQTSRRVFTAAITCASLFRGLATASPRSELLFLYSDKTSDANRAILSVLQSRFPQAKHVDEVSQLTPESSIGVAVGPSALRTILDSGGRVANPIISIFTSRQIFERLSAGGAIGILRSKRLSAIYAETSAESQFRLIISIFRRPVAVAVLISERSAHLEVEIRRAAQKLNLDVLIEFVKGEADAVKALSLANRAAVLLAIPDQQIYSVGNVRAILESCYRRGQVVIGFNPSLVQAGALATTYSTIEDISDQLDGIVSGLHTGHVVDAGYPLYWRTIFNEQIARSLNIPIPEDARLLMAKPGSR